MKREFFKLLNAMLALILSLIGYESCKEETEDAEYGTPTAEYIFRGKVTDLEGNALPNVKVSFVSKYVDEGQLFISEDSLTSTDAEGRYVARPRDLYWKSDAGLSFSLGDDVYKDTFLTHSDLAPLKGGDGRWFEGRSENTIDITLDIPAGK
jgi:putative lipoprotein (rSAM/lipoprotein system)